MKYTFDAVCSSYFILEEVRTLGDELLKLMIMMLYVFNFSATSTMQLNPNLVNSVFLLLE